jgi:hypothetical protein
MLINLFCFMVGIYFGFGFFAMLSMARDNSYLDYRSRHGRGN